MPPCPLETDSILGHMSYFTALNLYLNNRIYFSSKVIIYFILSFWGKGLTGLHPEVLGAYT